MHRVTKKSAHKNQQIRPSLWTAVYPHMPIIRVARAHVRIARFVASQRGQRNRFVRFWAPGEASREQSSSKWKITCPERRWTNVQKFTPLALSSAEKFVTVQTHKNKQTNKKQPIYPHLAYRQVWMMNTQITNAHTKSAVERSSDKPESPSLNIASS